MLLLALSGLHNTSFGQLAVVDGLTATEMANILAGEGVIVTGATLSAGCPTTARGKFNWISASPIGIDSGIALTSGRISNGGGFALGINNPYNSNAASSFTPPTASDPDLNALLAAAGSSSTTQDVCALEFDFVPSGDSVKFRYVFGSEEYPEYACSNFNDVFGFFISGPGFAGLTNLARVPGTTIPVAINTINNNTSGSAFCSAPGPGSPFSAYYVDNQNVVMSPYFVYDGYTTVLTALAAVSPCDTYHLKLAIADAGDQTLDSGVLLEAGSLSSTAINVETFGGAGLEVPYTNVVRGCPPGRVRVSRSGGTNSAITVPLTVLGTATNGTDMVFIPDTVVIPAGSSFADIAVVPYVLPAAVGPKTVIISVLSPYSCGGVPVILGSDTITILDSLYVNIPQVDTAICIGQSITLHADADSLVTLVWTPSATIDNPLARTIIATPTSTTTYTATVSILGVACPSASDKVVVKVKVPPAIDFGGPKVACVTGGVHLEPVLTPPDDGDYTYSWTPSVGLSSTVIRDPIASPTTTTIYRLTVNPGAVGCSSSDTVRVKILPNFITLLNNDTTLCEGSVINLNAIGASEFSYQWTPEFGIANPLVPSTTLTATTSNTYTITASYPGCLDMVRSFDLVVEPVPIVNLGPDKIICSRDTLQLFANVIPSAYPDYIYEWHPGIHLSDSTAKNPKFQSFSDDVLYLTVRTPNGCTDRDTIGIKVNNSNFMTLAFSDTGVCPPARLKLGALGAASYKWSPDSYLSSDTAANPIATPSGNIVYTVTGTSADGCVDSQTVTVDVYPRAVTTLPDTVQIWPGEQYEIDMRGNALYYKWFPPEGLSNANISRPIASPLVRTRYYVDARTENNCKTRDSIDIVVNNESILTMPNAFVPGNSNVNNGTFKILYRGIVTLGKFEIFNRWGNKVFETTDINKGWNGNFNEKPQPTGVYIYRVEAATNTGTPFIKTGNVTLIR